MVHEKGVIGGEAANGWLPELLPFLASAFRGAPFGVSPPVLPFVEHHKPHDRMNTLVSPLHHLACLPCAFADNGWPTTSLMENIWQWSVLAIAFTNFLA